MAEQPQHSAEEVAPDWRVLGCKTAPLIKADHRLPKGRGAWRLRADRRSAEDWLIEAKHCPYLGVHPYNHGDDAWRISIQTPHNWRSDQMVERAYLVAKSEAEAFEAVTWLDAVAQHIGGEPQP